jgi:uncharacterized protein YndB with AHSA1/START domain
MVRRLLLLAPIAAAAAWLADRWLAGRRGGAPADAMRMLVVVDAPIEETWAAVADVPLQLEWMREMKRITVETPGPARVGTRAEAVVRILGIPAPDPVEIVEFEPPHRYAIRHLGLFKGEGLITLEAGADGSTTIVRWEERLAPPILPSLGRLLADPVLRPIFQADLHRLKRLVETGSADD